MEQVARAGDLPGEKRDAEARGGDERQPRFRAGGHSMPLAARRDGDRRRFNRCRTDVVMDWNGGEWALYNNRSFAPDSYNDWWHDRPDRAYPAWMRRNQDCQRQWFSGNVLTC